MQIDPSFIKNSDYIIDEDEDMMDIENSEDNSSASASVFPPQNETTAPSGTSLSRYAGTIPEKRSEASIPSRSHWHNEYYRQGMDLKKKH